MYADVADTLIWAFDCITQRPIAMVDEADDLGWALAATAAAFF